MKADLTMTFNMLFTNRRYVLILLSASSCVVLVGLHNFVCVSHVDKPYNDTHLDEKCNVIKYTEMDDVTMYQYNDTQQLNQNVSKTSIVYIYMDNLHLSVCNW